MADSLEYAFKPITLKLNDEDFRVELEPTCWCRYCDLDPCGDSNEERIWDNFNGTRCDYGMVDLDEPALSTEYVVRYISWDRTVMVVLAGMRFAEVPAKIAVPSTALGYYHDGTTLIVGDSAVKARGVRIYETTAEDKLAINKERSALEVLAAVRASAAGRSAVGVVEADSEKNADGSPAGDTEATGGANRVEEVDEAADLQRAGGTDDLSQGMGAANVSKVEQMTWIFSDLRIEKRGDEPHVKIGDGEVVALEGQCRKIVNAMLALGATSEDKAKSTKDILSRVKTDMRNKTQSTDDKRLQTAFLAPGKNEEMRRELWKNYFFHVGEGVRGDPKKYFLGEKPKSTPAATPIMKTGRAGSKKVRTATARRRGAPARSQPRRTARKR